MGPDRRTKGPRKPPPPLDQAALEAIVPALQRYAAELTETLGGAWPGKSDAKPAGAD